MKRIPEKDLGHMIENPETPANVTITPEHWINALIHDYRAVAGDKLNSEGKQLGLAVALEQIKRNMEASKTDGVIATMPLLIAAKSRLGRNVGLNALAYNALSEENSGLDYTGELVRASQPIVVVVHGGGMLIKGAIAIAISNGLTENGGAGYENFAFKDLLEGKLPIGGKCIDIYSVDDVRKGNIPNPFGRHGVWVSVDDINKHKSGFLLKEQFMNHPLVLARAGTPDYLEAYFDRVKDPMERVCVSHTYDRQSFDPPQGINLSIYPAEIGLNGSASLDNKALFAWFPRPGVNR